MKTYEEFIREAYKKSYGEIDEGLGTFAAKAGRFIPGLQTAAGLGLAGYRLYKGDKTGAALAAGSAIPGPVGWGFAGADIARELTKNKQSAKPATTTKPTPASKPETKPSEASATTSPTRTPAPKPAAPVLSKKGGIEGTGIGKDFKAKAWTDTERQRYKSYTSAPSRVSRPQIGSLPPSARQVTQYPAGVPTGTSRQQPSTTPTTPKPTPATPSAPKPAPTPTKPVPTPKPTPATPSAPKPQPQKGSTGMPLVGGIERRIPTSAELKAAQGKRAVQTAQKSFASSFTSPAKVSPTKPTPKPVPKPTLKST